MRAVVIVLKKELRETLRDGHVLGFSIGFPILFYPLMLWAGLQVAFLLQGIAEQDPPRVALSGVEAHEAGGMDATLFAEPVIRVQASREDLVEDRVDVVVEVTQSGEALAAKVWHHSTRPRSERGVSLVEERLDQVRIDRMAELAAAIGAETKAIESWEIEYENVSPTGEMRAGAVAMALPGAILIALMIGALYPAVDLFVGERERNTLETTLVAAVSRRSIVAGKVLAIVVLITIGVAGNALALTLALVHALATIDQESVGGLTLSGTNIAMAVPTVVATAVLVAGLMAVVVLPAKSFKEGQNRTSIVATIGMLLPLLAMIPDPETTLGMAVIPLCNTALVMRDAIRGDLTAPVAGLTFLSNGTLGLVILWLGGRLMSREDYLFAKSGPPGFLTLLRRTPRPEGGAR